MNREKNNNNAEILHQSMEKIRFQTTNAAEVQLHKDGPKYNSNGISVCHVSFTEQINLETELKLVLAWTAAYPTGNNGVQFSTS